MNEPKERSFQKTGNSWVLKNRTGKVIRQFGNIDAFPLLSVLVVKQNGLFGLIGLNGEMALPCEYQNICQPFSPNYDGSKRHEVLLLTDQYGRYWLADRNGSIVTSRGYTRIGDSSYSDDRFSTMSCNGFVGLFDQDEPNEMERSGLFDMIHVKEILPPIYTPGSPFIDNLAGINSIGIPVYHSENGTPVCKLINAQGEDLIPFRKGYSWIDIPQEHEYLIRAEKNGKWGYINIEGAEKIPFQYDYAESFYGGYAVVGIRNGVKAESDNPTLNTRVGPEFRGYKDPTGAGTRYGVIDRHNKTIIPFIFHLPPTFQITDDGVFAEGTDSNWKKISYTWTSNP